MAGESQRTEKDVLLEQTQAKKLSPETQREVAQINVERQDPLKPIIEKPPIPERIQELFKKQAIAGQRGSPPLTPEEMKEIRDYNLSQIT